MHFIIVIAATLLIVFVFSCLEALIGMLLFNWVVSLFGGTFTVTFWQAFAVCMLLTFIAGFFKKNSTSKGQK